MNYRTLSLVAFSAVLLPLSTVCMAEDVLEAVITAEDREHWSFLPLALSAAPPILKDSSACETPIDYFIAYRQQTKGLKFSPLASRGQLIRRLTFDLTGLPPTPIEIDDFLADERVDAYERLVDRLLSSPAYGEHQAQFWLDLARFAETDGYEHDKIRPNAWRYRDWVIRATNRDLPYDQFVRAQIAGDLAAGNLAAGNLAAGNLAAGNLAAGNLVNAVDDDAKTATAFCLAGPDMPDINSQDERRHILLNELTSTVGSVFLGLQVGCAQCHDHKYDPVSQADFYRLRAFFNSAVSVTKNNSVNTLAEQTKDVPKSFLMIRGSWDRPGAELTAAFPRVLVANTPSDKSTTTSTRRDLADWLTSPTNPIAARVIANRIWQQHFGRGLSSMPSDFGLIGNEPSHPKLLDWLAAELILSRWSIKTLRRSIVTSTTYRQRSLTQSNDSQNDQLYTRYPRRRLTGEQIRDAMLLISGELNSRQFGEGIRPPLPPELTKTLLNNQWQVTPDKSEHTRRSIYIFARRNLRYPIFDAFDRPDANSSCSERSKSTTAPQSLLLFNSEFSLSTARRMAGRLVSLAPSQQIRQAVQLAWGRVPSESELTILTSFLTKQANRIESEDRQSTDLALPIPDDDRMLAPSARAALVDLCLALINANEFVYYD